MGWTLLFIVSIISTIFVIIRQLILLIQFHWASLVTVILFLGGIQLLALGIIGKYISKIF